MFDSWYYQDSDYDTLKRYYKNLDVGSLILDFANHRAIVIDREPWQITSQIETDILIHILRYISSLYYKEFTQIVKFKQPQSTKRIRIISNADVDKADDHDDDAAANVSLADDHHEPQPIFSQETASTKHSNVAAIAAAASVSNSKTEDGKSIIDTVIYLPRIDSDLFNEATIQRDLHKNISNLLIVSV